MMKPIHPEARIGHVHLKVADLERALGFYRDVLGFEVTQRYGRSAAFLSAGGYHHHIGLNTWESLGGGAPPAGSTGLYHLAIAYPTRGELADGLRRLRQAGIPLASKGRLITELARRCTFATRMATESSFIGIDRVRSGRRRRMESWPWSPNRLI
jgi:catechol-2,3-dioxygenase